MEKPEILTPEEVKAELLKLPGWKYGDNKIFKRFKFKDFLDSLGFVNSLAPYFESMDHHPDVHIMYSDILFELQRFDVGGQVTDRDIAEAHEIESRYKNRK